jgi:hypothetical protein
MVLQVLHPGPYGSKLPKEQQLELSKHEHLQIVHHHSHSFSSSDHNGSCCHHHPYCPSCSAKLSFTQQIHVLEDCMTKEEHGAYLEVHDMGKDFCAAGY